MIESNLVAGKQSIPQEGPSGLTYGQSVTDGKLYQLSYLGTAAVLNPALPISACIDWETTVSVLDNLRAGVQARRKLRGANGTSSNLESSIASSKTNGQHDFNDLSSLKVGQNAL